MWPCASWLQLAKTVMRSSSHTHYTATFVIPHAFGTLSLRAFKSGLCFAYPAFHNLKTNRRGRCSLVKMFTRRARDKTHGRQWHHALGRPPGSLFFACLRPRKNASLKAPSVLGSGFMPTLAKTSRHCTAVQSGSARGKADYLKSIRPPLCST